MLIDQVERLVLWVRGLPRWIYNTAPLLVCVFVHRWRAVNRVEGLDHQWFWLFQCDRCGKWKSVAEEDG